MANAHLGIGRLQDLCNAAYEEWFGGVGGAEPGPFGSVHGLLDARKQGVFCGEPDTGVAVDSALRSVGSDLGEIARMGRYFFHPLTCDGEMEDEVGVEVDDTDLRREAMRAVLELQAEFGGDDENGIVLGFRVVNELGRTVLELPSRTMAYSSH